MLRNMMRLTFLSAALIVLISLTSLKAAELAVGASAPAFSLKNVDGKDVSLAEMKDCKALLVVFFSNACPFSQEYQSRLIALYNDYHPKGVAMVLVSSNDSKKQPQDGFENMQKRAQEKKYPFPYLFDESQSVAKAYGATNTPHAFLFDGGLKLIYRGRIDDNTEEAKVKKRDVREALDHILDGTADKIETRTTKPFGCTIKWRES